MQDAPIAVCYNIGVNGRIDVASLWGLPLIVAYIVGLAWLAGYWLEKKELLLKGSETMDLSRWFSTQLDASVEGFLWAIEQAPPERRLATPPKALGEWNVARHLFHMVYYEQGIVLPSMKIWLDEPFTFNEEEEDEDADWGEGREIEPMVAEFRDVRAQQIVLLSQFSEQLWEDTRPTIWGDKTLKWVVTKTYQHTNEHTHDVLRMALFWDTVRPRGATEEDNNGSDVTE